MRGFRSALLSATGASLLLVMAACGSVQNPVAQASPSPASSSTPATPTPATELKFVAKVEPSTYPAAPVVQTVKRTVFHVTPFNEGGLDYATAARVSPGGPLGSITQYDVNLNYEATPRNLTVGPGGVIWFSSNNNAAVGSVAVDGTVIEYTLPGYVGRGGMITLGPDGDLWFGLSGSDWAFVGRLSPSGTYAQFAIHGTPDFLSPGPDGAVWITEGADDRIVRIAHDGSERDYLLPGLNRPSTIVLGHDGAVWFTTAVGIGRLTPDGSYSQIELMGTARDLAFAPDGRLWVTVAHDQYSGELQQWSATGRMIQEFRVDFAPVRVTVSEEATVWSTGLAWTAPGRLDGRLVKVGNGELEILALTNSTFGNGFVTLHGSVWFSDLGINRYDP